jgi:hypothetical protein
LEVSVDTAESSVIPITASSFTVTSSMRGRVGAEGAGSAALVVVETGGVGSETAVDVCAGAATVVAGGADGDGAEVAVVVDVDGRGELTAAGRVRSLREGAAGASTVAGAEIAVGVGVTEGSVGVTTSSVVATACAGSTAGAGCAGPLECNAAYPPAAAALTQVVAATANTAALIVMRSYSFPLILSKARTVVNWRFGQHLRAFSRRSGAPEHPSEDSPVPSSGHRPSGHRVIGPLGHRVIESSATISPSSPLRQFALRGAFR